MLAVAKIKEAERLLAEGNLSQRKIAKAVGISRSTLSSIVAGTRPDYEALQRAQEADWEPLGPATRCPGCGGMVYTPCRLCRVRQLKDQEEAAARDHRRRARQLALAQLLTALRNASHQREMSERASA